MNPYPTIFIIAVVLLFATGVYSLLVTKNLMRVLISIEVITKAVTLLLVGAGYISGNMAKAQAYVVTVIIIEVMLLVIATGLVLGVYRANDSLNTGNINNLKG